MHHMCNQLSEYIDPRLSQVYNRFIYNTYKHYCDAWSILDRNILHLNCNIYLPVMFGINKYSKEIYSLILMLLSHLHLNFI